MESVVYPLPLHGPVSCVHGREKDQLVCTCSFIIIISPNQSLDRIMTFYLFILLLVVQVKEGFVSGVCSTREGDSDGIRSVTGMT